MCQLTRHAPARSCDPTVLRLPPQEAPSSSKDGNNFSDAPITESPPRWVHVFNMDDTSMNVVHETHDDRHVLQQVRYTHVRREVWMHAARSLHSQLVHAAARGASSSSARAAVDTLGGLTAGARSVD